MSLSVSRHGRMGSPSGHFHFAGLFWFCQIGMKRKWPADAESRSTATHRRIKRRLNQKRFVSGISPLCLSTGTGAVRNMDARQESLLLPFCYLPVALLQPFPSHRCLRDAPRSGKVKRLLIKSGPATGCSNRCGPRHACPEI